MSETVTLGGRDFALRPPRLGELRGVLDALDGCAGHRGGALLDAAAAIIHAGLRAARPELTLDDVLALEASVDEVNAAVAAVLRVAGLVRLGEREPPARITAAGGGPGSAPSMPPSPPAAATPIARSTT